MLLLLLPPPQNTYKALFDKMRSAGITENYVFYAPPSPEGIQFADQLLNGRKGGLTHAMYCVRRSGAVGIALDYPAWAIPDLGLPQCFRMLEQDYRACRAAGLKFMLVLVGNENVAKTKAAMDWLGAKGIWPDSICVDNFGTDTHPGVPETGDNNLSAQTLAVVRHFGVAAARQ